MEKSYSKSVVQTFTDKIIIECRLLNDANGKLIDLPAQVDTGAERSCISQRVVDALNLDVCGSCVVYDWEGEKKVDLYSVGICIFKSFALGYMPVHLINTPDVDLLVGMDVLSYFDFSYSLVDGRPVFRMRYPHSSDPIT